MNPALLGELVDEYLTKKLGVDPDEATSEQLTQARIFALETMSGKDNE